MRLFQLLCMSNCRSPWSASFSINFENWGLAIEEPTVQDLATAEKIATSAIPGNGYPTLFDSIYHAMALERGGIFVTADQRHIAKAAQFDSAVLLADWQAG